MFVAPKCICWQDKRIYSQLSVVQASDYDNVKELILKGYELVPEAYRQHF